MQLVSSGKHIFGVSGNTIVREVDNAQPCPMAFTPAPACRGAGNLVGLERLVVL